MQIIWLNFEFLNVDDFQFTKEELETMNGVEIIEKEILKSKYPKGKNKKEEVDQ